MCSGELPVSPRTRGNCFCCSAVRSRDVEDPFGWVDTQGVEWIVLGFGEFGALAEGAGRSGERDSVQALGFVAEVAPGLSAGGCGDADERQRSRPAIHTSSGA